MIPKRKYLRVYNGKEKIKRLIEQFSAMQKTGETVYSFGYEDKFDQALGKDWWKTLRKTKTAHTKFYGLFSWHKKARKPTSKRAKTRYVNAGRGETEIAIYKDTVRIFCLTKKNPYAILIRDPEVAKGFMNYWKFLWQQGKEARK
jgi:hypothetical protein